MTLCNKQSKYCPHLIKLILYVYYLRTLLLIHFLVLNNTGFVVLIMVLWPQFTWYWIVQLYSLTAGATKGTGTVFGTTRVHPKLKLVSGFSILSFVYSSLCTMFCLILSFLFDIVKPLNTGEEFKCFGKGK